MKVNNIFSKIVYMAAVGASIFALFFVVTCVWIGYEVKSQCQEAKRQYGGQCTIALISKLNDENNNMSERNTVIWALGQLGDRSALPVLEKYYTGQIPAREPLDKVLSQYELKKAIKLAKGGINITGVFWKYGIE